MTKLKIPAQPIPNLSMESATIFAQATVLDGRQTVALRVSAAEGSFAVTYLPPALARSLAASLAKAALEAEANGQAAQAEGAPES